jgi:aspartate dehydrogenase
MAGYDAGGLGPFMRVGVVGCGRVGRTVCRAIDAGLVHADLAAVCDVDAERAQTLIFELKRPTRSMTLSGLVSSVEVVVEATNRHVAPDIMMAALNGGRDLVVTNTAAILARDDFGRLARERGLTILAANVMLAGDTALNTAATRPGAGAKLTLSCPRAVLADAPFLRGRELQSSEEPVLVFQGEPADAMAAFPALANMVAAAAIGAGRTELLVRVHAHAQPDVTDIELTVSADRHQTTTRARVPIDGAEPVAPEVIGMITVGILRSLVSSVRLA